MPSEASPRDDSGPKSPSGSGSASLEEILDQYLQELAEGGSPDQEAYLQAHPDLADALRGVFKTLDFVEATSKSLNSSTLEKGQQLGEYRIVREVARGGMGVVYEAIQTSLNRRVALKVLPTGAILSGHAAERFAREAATAGRLHHTNIVPVYAVGEEQGIHFYAMQFIEGRSLSEHLKTLRRSGTAPGHDYFKRVAHWGQQAAEALACAHGQGTIHRDIKPSNLLLDARDNVWVTDFGLARGDAQATITVSGDVIGTARYMSPEQARGGRTQLDGRTDIYSLGATMYELLALAPAFDGESREAVLNQIAFADPAPLRQVNRAIPRDLETIVGKCMEKDPDRRYRSANDVAEDCRRFRAGESIRARRTPAITKAIRYVKRHRVHAAGVAIALVLLVATVAMVAKYRRVREQTRLDEFHTCLNTAYDALLLRHDATEAERWLDEAETYGMDSAKLHLYRGLIPLMHTQPQRALAPLTRALQVNSRDVEVCYALAMACYATGDVVTGLQYFDRANEQEPKTALGWLLRGYCLSDREPDVAVEAYNQALKLRPDFTPAIRARSFYRANRLLIDGAREELRPMLNDYEAWVTFWPDDAGSYAARATGWRYAAAFAATRPDLRDFAEEWLNNAETDVARAQELAPNDMLHVAVHAATLRYRGDFAGAEAAFARAIELDREAAGDEHPGIVHHYVNALYAQGKLQEALDAVTPAAQALPSFFALPLQRALLLAELGQLDQARAQCRETLRQHNAGASGTTISAGIMEMLGDPDAARDAVEDFERLHGEEVDHDAPERGGVRPELDYLLGRLDDAGLIDAAQGHPGWLCEYHFLIGTRKLGQGERDRAVAAFQACLDTQVFPYIQHRFAQVFLARAQADPQWPAWLSVANQALPASPQDFQKN